MLTREQPGVISMVLRHVPGPLAAEILDLLPSELRRRVIVFMCTADPPSDEIVSRVESLLNAKTGGSRKTKKTSENDKLDVVTAIIQHAKRSVEEDLLAAIQEKSEALATEIRDRLFTFEDIVKLGDMAVRRLMQEIDMSVLGIALRNAPLELREKFTNNMSKRAAEGLKEEMDLSQKVRLTDVEAKQREIVNAVRTLATDGQVSLSGEDEYV
jgi:flagellar motor switch protein FliG